MQIVFIRHSMTAGNLERRYIGCRTDEPLCEAGISLAQQKTAEIRQTFPMPEVVLTSPMRRCVQTAEILFPDTPREIVYGLQECDFGDFEGKNYAELSGDPAYQAWIDSNGTLPFPEGESRAEFIDRVCAGMENAADYLRNYAQSNMCRDCGSDREVTVAAVVHGGTIMALLSHYGGGDYYDYQVENAGGFTCRILIAGEQIRFVTQERGFR